MKQWWLRLRRRTFEDGYARTVIELMLRAVPISEAMKDLKGKSTNQLDQYDLGRYTAASQLKKLFIKSQKRGIKICK